jgi:hypothetical protein
MSCKKQQCLSNVMQRFKEQIILCTEMMFKAKSLMYKTSSSIRSSENLMEPQLQAIETSPFGRVIDIGAIML